MDRGCGGQGSQGSLPAITLAPPRGAHSLGELPQLGLDTAVAHAHARERRADVPRGPWRGKRASWEGARLDLCNPGLRHERASWPAKARAATRAPPPVFRNSAGLSGAFDHSPVVTEPFLLVGPTPCPRRPCQPPAAGGCSGGQATSLPSPAGRGQNQRPSKEPDKICAPAPRPTRKPLQVAQMQA